MSAVISDEDCPARYWLADGTSVGCERGVHLGTDLPKPDEHLCEVTIRWTGGSVSGCAPPAPFPAPGLCWCYIPGDGVREVCGPYAIT